MNSQELEEVFCGESEWGAAPCASEHSWHSWRIPWDESDLWKGRLNIPACSCQPGQGCVGFIMLQLCVQGIFLRLSLLCSCSSLQKNLVFASVSCSLYSKFYSPSGHSHSLKFINYLLSGWSQGLCSGHLEEEVEAEMAALSIETWALLSSDVGGPHSVKQHHKLLK